MSGDWKTIRVASPGAGGCARRVCCTLVPEALRVDGKDAKYRLSAGYRCVVESVALARSMSGNCSTSSTLLCCAFTTRVSPRHFKSISAPARNVGRVNGNSSRRRLPSTKHTSIKRESRQNAKNNLCVLTYTMNLLILMFGKRHSVTFGDGWQHVR